MDKAQLRQQLREAVHAMRPPQRAMEEELLNALLGTKMPTDLPVVAYMALPHEVSLTSFLNARWLRGAPVLLPRVAGESLEICLVPSSQDLVPGAYGILEPGPHCEIAPVSEHVIVPGLGFTVSGQRLGLGKGFYDRFLAAHPKCKTVSVAFAPQVVAELPMEPHDQPVGAVWTWEFAL